METRKLVWSRFMVIGVFSPSVYFLNLGALELHLLHYGDENGGPIRRATWSYGKLTLDLDLALRFLDSFHQTTLSLWF